MQVPANFFTLTATDRSRLALYKRAHTSIPHAVRRKEGAMRRDAERSGEWTEGARRRVGQVTAALREAQARGEVVTACEPEAVAHFLVASLEGAVFVSKLTRDPTVMQQCVSELGRYLALYEVRSGASC
jgi:tetracycline repressor-like protein